MQQSRIGIIHLDPMTIDPLVVFSYKRFVPEHFHFYFDPLPPSTSGADERVLLAATVQGEPTGILLATIRPPPKVAEVHFLFVDAHFRNQGIATRLLSQLEKIAIERNCFLITKSYPAQEALTPVLEKILSHLKWNQPVLSKIYCKLDRESFNPSWMRQCITLPQGFELFLWDTLSLKDRELLFRKKEQGIFDEEVSPFKEEKVFEPLNSMGMRYKGEVVGWVMTRRIHADTIRYTAFFIEKSIQSSGVAVRMLQDSIDRQWRAQTIPFGEFEIDVKHTPASWRSFVKRHLLPYAVQTTYTHISWKYL